MTSVRMVDPERATPLMKMGLTISWLCRFLVSVNDSRFPRAFQKRTVLATILLAKWSPVGTWDAFLEDTLNATPGDSELWLYHVEVLDAWINNGFKKI